MNTCKNCAYWETHQYWGEKPFHACDKVDRRPDFAMKIEVSDDTGLTSHLITGPEFGCVHFEARGGTMSIEIGKQYIFDYPKEFVTLPEYSKRRKKIVVVESLVQAGNEDEEAMYQIRGVEDGWIGQAFESELIS